MQLSYDDWPPRMWRPLYIAYKVFEGLVSLVSRTINAIAGGSTRQTFSARCHVEAVLLQKLRHFRRVAMSRRCCCKS